MTVEAIAIRNEIRELADRLVDEYAGLIVPGRVVSCVLLTAHEHLAGGRRGPHLSGSIEHSARRRLQETVPRRRRTKPSMG
jgi:hypothetical protein